jgi:exonuclease SbcC
MKIKRLQIRNFLGLREIDIIAKDVNVFKGKNRQGKTSLLKAIEAAFVSGNQADKIRKGEDSASILIELDEAYISRTIPASGKPSLTVWDTNGEDIKRPQEYLDSIVGGFAFNPAEFFLCKQSEQVQYVLESFPLRLTQAEIEGWTKEPFPLALEMLKSHALVIVEKLRKHYYDIRTVSNRTMDAKLKAGQEQAKLIPKDVVVDDYDPNEYKGLLDDISKGEQENARRFSLDEDVKRIDTDIADLERKISQKRQERLGKVSLRDSIKVVDVTGLKDRMTELQKQKDHINDVEKLTTLRQEYVGAREESARLDKIVQTLSVDVPGQLMKRINLPVKDMVIADDGLLVDGKGFDLLSGQEQVDIAIGIAKAMAGKLKIVCVDGIEKLDDDAYALFIKAAETDKDFQFFTTQVGSRGNGITIEDGMVKMEELKKQSR